MVDDEIVTVLGTKIDPEKQRVEVDGVVLRPEGERKRYYPPQQAGRASSAPATDARTGPARST